VYKEALDLQDLLVRKVFKAISVTADGLVLQAQRVRPVRSEQDRLEQQGPQAPKVLQDRQVLLELESRALLEFKVLLDSQVLRVLQEARECRELWVTADGQAQQAHRVQRAPRVRLEQVRRARQVQLLRRVRLDPLDRKVLLEARRIREQRGHRVLLDLLVSRAPRVLLEDLEQRVLRACEVLQVLMVLLATRA